jgi:hypothetical protein
MPWNGSVTSAATWSAPDPPSHEDVLSVSRADLAELEMTYLRLSGEIEASREEVRQLTTRFASVAANLREAAARAELWLNADPLAQAEYPAAGSPPSVVEESALLDEPFTTFDEVSIGL